MTPKAPGEASPRGRVQKQLFCHCWQPPGDLSLVGAGSEGGAPVTPRVLCHNCVQVVMRTLIGFSVISLRDTEIEEKHSLPARNLGVTGVTDKKGNLRQTVISARKGVRGGDEFLWRDPRKHRHISVSISSVLNNKDAGRTFVPSSLWLEILGRFSRVFILSSGPQMSVRGHKQEYQFSVIGECTRSPGSLYISKNYPRTLSQSLESLQVGKICLQCPEVHCCPRCPS